MVRDGLDLDIGVNGGVPLVVGDSSDEDEENGGADVHQTANCVVGGVDAAAAVAGVTTTDN